MAEARELAEQERDPEMQAYARQEFEKQQAERDRLDGELKLALVPKDPTDDKDVIIEIRQGTGGDEAGLFAADLFRMYSRYAESRRGENHPPSGKRARRQRKTPNTPHRQI